MWSVSLKSIYFDPKTNKCHCLQQPKTRNCSIKGIIVIFTLTTDFNSLALLSAGKFKSVL